MAGSSMPAKEPFMSHISEYQNLIIDSGPKVVVNCLKGCRRMLIKPICATWWKSYGSFYLLLDHFKIVGQIYAYIMKQEGMWPNVQVSSWGGMVK